MKKMNRAGLLVVVSGPSGAGKGTVLKELLKKDENIVVPVSATTRAPRNGEVDGVNYHFLTKEQFEEKIKNDDMLEFVKYADNYYGTIKKTVKEALNQGKDVVLEIEVMGADIIKRKYPSCIRMFIVPPSVNELYNRLLNRGSESQDAISTRLDIAKNEFTHKNKYDYVILNDDVEAAAQNILKIINECRNKYNKT